MSIIAIFLFVGAIISRFKNHLQTAAQCIPDNNVLGMEVIQPILNTVVGTSVFYIRMTAMVVNIPEFQDANADYTFCIRSYFMPSINDKQFDLQKSTVYSKCGLAVFDEHPLPCYNSKFSLNSDGTQIYNVEVELVHTTDGVICHTKRIITCIPPTNASSINHSHSSYTEATKKGRDIQQFLQFGSQWQKNKRITDANQIFLKLAGFQQVTSAISPLVRVIIGIKSYALHAEHRQSVRNTWLTKLRFANHDTDIQFLPYFIIGNATNHSTDSDTNDKISRLLSLEQSIYGDILLGNEIPVLDSYFTLHQKSLQFISWIVKKVNSLSASSTYDSNIDGTTSNTPQNVRYNNSVDYIILCDDDVYVDMIELSKYLLLVAKPTRFYAGEVLEYRMKHVYKPQRDPTHANYLSFDQFPLTVLPPFALGNFYILSYDVAQWLAKNSKELKSTGTLEDLSIGVWLMSLQVFPVHLSGVCDPHRCLYDMTLFSSLTTTSTSNSSNNEKSTQVGDVYAERVIAVSDIRTSALMHTMHKVATVTTEVSNSNRVSVDNDGERSKLNRMQTLLRQIANGDTEQLFSNGDNESSIDSISINNELIYQKKRHIHVNAVVTINSLYAVGIMKDILRNRYAHLDSVYNYTVQFYVLNTEVLVKHVSKHREGTTVENDWDITELVYKLQDDMQTATILDESEISTLFHTQVSTNSIDNAVDTHLVLLTGILDLTPKVIHNFTGYPVIYWDVDYSNRLLNSLLEVLRYKVELLVLISGEPVDLSDVRILQPSVTTDGNANTIQQIDLDVMILTTTTDRVLQPRISQQSYENITLMSVYLPTFVTSFYELQQAQQSLMSDGITVSSTVTNYSPQLLLQQLSSAEIDNILTTKKIVGNTVAYLYHRCDRPEREEFYNILSRKFNEYNSKHAASVSMGDDGEQLKVIALGKCNGGQPNSNTTTDFTFSSRYSNTYLQSAIDVYSGFKFVIAFENIQLNGYITEKLTNAYLAHSIPIYFGAPDVTKYFNPHSMINCNDFSTLDLCADRVLEVNNNKSLYRNMLSESILRGESMNERENVFKQLFPW